MRDAKLSGASLGHRGGAAVVAWRLQGSAGQYQGMGRWSAALQTWPRGSQRHMAAGGDGARYMVDLKRRCSYGELVDANE